MSTEPMSEARLAEIERRCDGKDHRPTLSALEGRDLVDEIRRLRAPRPDVDALLLPFAEIRDHVARGTTFYVDNAEFAAAIERAKVEKS